MPVHSNAGHKSIKVFILLTMLVKKKKKPENSLESSVNMERQGVIIGLPSIG